VFCQLHWREVALPRQSEVSQIARCQRRHRNRLLRRRAEGAENLPYGVSYSVACAASDCLRILSSNGPGRRRLLVTFAFSSERKGSQPPEDAQPPPFGAQFLASGPAPECSHMITQNGAVVNLARQMESAGPACLNAPAGAGMRDTNRPVGQGWEAVRLRVGRPY
jgi:hypothetical protein